MGVYIRKYRDSDFNDLMATWENANNLAHPFLKEDFVAQVRMDIAALYLPNADTWVADADNHVVGFMALLGNEVGAIFLQPEYQGKKIGKLMMDKAQELHGDLVVDVFEKNSIGRNFYSQYGFQLTGDEIHVLTGEKILHLKFTANK